MKHTVRIVIVLAMVAAASAVVSTRVPARAVSGVEAGYWWQGQPDGNPLPPPGNVPANGLWVSGSESQQAAIAAVRFRLADGEVGPVLSLKVRSQFPPRDSSGASTVGQLVVLACPTTTPWQPAQAGAWNSRPQGNCATAATGNLAGDGSTITFDLTGFVKDNSVDVVLAPGPGAAVLPATPVPGAPPTPSGFDVTFDPVGPDAVRVTPGATGAADVPAPTADAAPSTASDIGVSTEVPAVGGPAPDFNFAADAIAGSAGTGASSQPAVAPGSLSPQVRETTSSEPEENKGYRALAVILLAVLLWWAWRQAVPARAGRRTIYDGPPVTA